MWICRYSKRRGEAAKDTHDSSIKLHNALRQRTFCMMGMSRIATALVLALISIGCASSGAGAQGDAGAPPPNDANSQWSGQPYTESVPGTTVGLEMVPIPGGTVEVETPRGTQRVEIAPFYMSRIEVPWEVFDVWVFALDEGTQVATGKGEDAVSRPSRPYVLPGRNFGHDGLPALAMTYHSATVFATWLSDKTGHRYRLPTEAEWEYACRANAAAPGDLATHAWYSANSDDRTHPGATRELNGFGLADMIGNVGEWAQGNDGEPILKGGSFADPDTRIGCDAGAKQT